MIKAKHFLLLSSLLGGLLTSCAQMCPMHPKAGQVEHVVLVWLKKKGDAATRTQIVDATHTFQDIPGVISISSGDPIPSKRPVVDASFDVGIAIRFKDKASLDAYEKNPKHEKMVKELLKPAAQKIVVHDFTVR